MNIIDYLFLGLILGASLFYLTSFLRKSLSNEEKQHCSNCPHHGNCCHFKK